MAAGALYTPEILGLAVALAARPLTADLRWRGEARSASCGSSLVVGLALDGEGRIARIGLAAQACAIGQASAALFADAAAGRDVGEIAAAQRALEAWLAGEGAMPDWPGLAVIAPAQGYPARHGAITLAWRAALAAMAQPPLAAA